MMKQTKRRARAKLLSLIFLLTVVYQAEAGQSLSHQDIQPMFTSVHHWVWDNQPHWSYEHGCTSYPAVDEFGNWSGGLKPSGSEGGGCRNSSGQTYTRVQWFSDGYAGNQNVRAAIMYAQYFPKDQWYGRHRHDWEEVVVWVDTQGQPIKAAFSAHGDYPRKVLWSATDPNWDGRRVRVQYTRSYFDTTHYVAPSTKNGWAPPLVAWGNISVQAQQALSRSWGSAVFPMGSNFVDKIAESW